MNAGIWLDLENYALKSARKDQMRISVITGPVFLPGDPVKYGIIIPVSFWKIIVFIHDVTHKLCATGYMLSQVDHLPQEEVVYGQHGTAQVPISKIRDLTKLDLGALVNIDPLAATEGSEQHGFRLGALEQIRFV